MTATCDARYATDDAGIAGRQSIIVSGEPEPVSVPVLTCGDDRVKVWHGMDTPAIACGFHSTYDLVAVFRGHRNRLQSEAAESTPKESK